MDTATTRRPMASKRATPSTDPNAGDDRLTAFLIKHRWATVVPVVLPLSKAYDVYWRLRHVYYRAWTNRADEHDARVKTIQGAVRAWNAAGRPGKLCTSRKGWQTVSARTSEYKADAHTVDLDLHDILEIDLQRKTIKVEPRANMGQISRELVRLGYTLPVVPELDDLTVGGLILGYGIESTSHRYGLFSDTVIGAEVVLGDGRVVWCTADRHADLFRALPWSYGSLGFLTAVELPIVPCKPYVHITYEPVRSLDDACARFTELVSPGGAGHVEGLMYSLHEGVMMSGEYADLPEGGRANPIGKWHKPWFYKHAETALRRGTFSEYLPVRDWFHRHTRSLYWHGELLVPFGNQPWFRHTLGWLMPPKVSFMKLTQTQAFKEYREKRNVVQDGLVPLRHMKACIEMFHRVFECYPLWLCPHLTPQHTPGGMMQPSAGEDEMYVDVGAWQVPGFVERGEAWDGRSAVKEMEAWLREHDSFQCLYAVTEQSEDEFWEMFDPTLYRKVREKYGAEGVFVDVYEKVRRR